MAGRTAVRTGHPGDPRHPGRPLGAWSHAAGRVAV